MQRVLARAKNGEELFWEEKFHAANGKVQACIQNALHFFLLSFGEGGERIFFIFPWILICSHYVPFKFPMGSHQVLNICSSSQCVPQHVLGSTSLLSNMLWQMLSSFHLYRWDKLFQNRTFYFGESP